MKQILTAAAATRAALLALALAPAPALSEETHSHPAPEKLGTVHFATSCIRSTERDFERAVALLHSFAYSAAEAAFRQVAMKDPGCAMARWGIAMSLYHQLWSPPGPEALKTGQTEIQHALQLKAHTPRERQFIEAAAAYYRDYEKLPHVERAKAYEARMAVVARQNPTDLEAQVFYALSLIATAPLVDRTHTNQKQAAAILEPIYRSHPDHPGIAHYLIHAYDSTELAPRGLAAARAYSQIAPSAPHALHMPSHIFTRLGLWDDSIASNVAARAAARREGDVGEELHAMDYLVYAYLQRGDQMDADRVVKDLVAMQGLVQEDFKVGYAATAMPVRLAMERHDWTSASGLQPLPGLPPQVAALVYWARAIGNARSGHPDLVTEDLGRLAACQATLQNAHNDYWASQVEILAMEAKAWQDEALGRGAEAVEVLRHAADSEDAVEKLPLTPGPVVPAREQLADLLLMLDRPKDALAEYQAALIAAPGRRGSLEGAARAAELIKSRPN